MAATENDPEVADIYIADGRLLNGGTARQAQATVATPGASDHHIQTRIIINY